MRFLFEWQRVAPGAQVSGPDALAGVLAQLEGFEAAAAAWESEILPARVSGYEISWLDDLCLAGRIVWARLRASNASHRANAMRGPVRATPIVLLQRRNLPMWTTLGGDRRTRYLRCLRARRRCSISSRNTAPRSSTNSPRPRSLLHTELEDALAELVAAGLQSIPTASPACAPCWCRRRNVLRRTGGADAARPCSASPMPGRWALLRRQPPVPEDAEKQKSIDVEIVEQIARTLLKRYGVVCWRLLAREAEWLPPWRELLRVYHRLEARGELRGGRFIDGLSGEQFALPEAVGLLRSIRRKPHDGTLVGICGADPLNLVGSIVAGANLPGIAAARVLVSRRHADRHPGRRRIQGPRTDGCRSGMDGQIPLAAQRGIHHGGRISRRRANRRLTTARFHVRRRHPFVILRHRIPWRSTPPVAAMKTPVAAITGPA